MRPTVGRDGRPTGGHPLLVLTSDDVAACLPRALAIGSQREAFRALADGTSVLGASAYARDGSSDALVFALTGMVDRSTGLVGKIGVQQPGNPARGLPNIHAVLVVFDPDDGTPVAVVDGNAITTLRTAAGLAVAADTLAPRSDKTLAVLGSGPQAVAAAGMIGEVRELERVLLWSPTRSRREHAVTELAGEFGGRVSAAASAQDAVSAAAIVATCTRSREPVVRGDWLRPGQTVLTIGCYAPDRREVDVRASARARTVVDELAKSRVLCGPLLEAVGAGVLVESEVPELGDVLRDPRLGRTDPDQIMIFHSLGVGVQDATAGWAVYEQAQRLGLGNHVRL